MKQPLDKKCKKYKQMHTKCKKMKQSLDKKCKQNTNQMQTNLNSPWTKNATNANKIKMNGGRWWRGNKGIARRKNTNSN